VKTIYVVVDAFWGDGGKGLISAWYGLLNNSLAVFRGCGGSGAEHGVFFEGKYIKTNQLPLGFLMTNSLIGIGPGTAIDPEKLSEEIKRFKLKPDQVKIDPRCPLITPLDIEEEVQSANMRGIGSTMSGTGACMAKRVLRTAPLAGESYDLKPFIENIPELANKLSSEGNIVLESSQGFGLSNYFGFGRYVTSVDVTTGSLIAGVGVDWRKIKEVILVVKALPTREGTGPMGNVEEFTVEEMVERGIVEYSSIHDPKTGKPNIRRKAKSIDWDILKRACLINGATQIALTFADHYDKNVTDITKWSDLTPKVFDLIEKIENITGVPVTVVNTGKSFNSLAWRYETPEFTDIEEERLRSYTGT